MARNSLNVSFAKSTVTKGGEILGNVLSQILPSISCRIVKFKALRSNAKPIYIGPSNLSVPNGTTNTTAGWPLYPGEETDWYFVDSLSRFEMIGENNTDSVVYVAYE